MGNKIVMLIKHQHVMNAIQRSQSYYLAHINVMKLILWILFVENVKLMKRIVFRMWHKPAPIVLHHYNLNVTKQMLWIQYADNALLEKQIVI